MADASFHFPRGFLWGSATAAHQVEGNNTNNDWWAWEQEPGRIFEGHKSGKACEWWNGRWREDMDRAKEDGQNAHRLSVEWSRIQPAPDRWNEEALDRYLEMVRGMTEMGITPLVTLHHFTNPLWLSETGGWENPDTPALFGKFVERVVERLKDMVNYWTTINEPNVYALQSYLFGNFPPGVKDLRRAMAVYANLVRGHAAAYHAIHRIQPTARAGIALHYRSLKQAHNWLPVEGWLTNLQFHLANQAFPDALVSGVFKTPLGKVSIPEAQKTQDYFGFNYYTRDYLTLDLTRPGEIFSRRYFRKDAQLSASGYLANEPEGMFEGLKWATRYGVPILVTENGVDDSTDTLRPTYLAEHLHQMWRAVNFNYPVKGYFHWSLLDNFEWERGWTQRFGLWELDEETQTRRKRPSADFYAEICRENGLTTELVARYAPALVERMFPN